MIIYGHFFLLPYKLLTLLSSSLNVVLSQPPPPPPTLPPNPPSLPFRDVVKFMNGGGARLNSQERVNIEKKIAFFGKYLTKNLTGG